MDCCISECMLISIAERMSNQMAGLNKVTVDDVNVKGKRVLVRVDFNVPMKDGVITNDNRIQAALPTINKLVSEGAKVILCSHLGKPKNGPEEKFSLKAAAARLAELVSAKVTFVPSDVVVDDTVKAAVDQMQDGEIIVLENTRFRKEETKNIESFSKDLASIADAFVMDAFGSAHRAHCSTVGVTEFVKETAVGYLMHAESIQTENRKNTVVFPVHKYAEPGEENNINAINRGGLKRKMAFKKSCGPV